ncbi:ABC transporter permease [Pseudoalteromonas fenneropenaei]|uniref:ABC transporter permease n=1 Tax=Pseudoalteromonas fenneropenaei TaxID=1737459 RepID=A0ABV7CLQ4_9GAMM
MIALTQTTYMQESKVDLLGLMRSPGFVLPALLFPCAFYFFFGVVFKHDASGASTYLLVNYCIFGIMGPALFNFGVHVAQDRETGSLTLKRLSPMPPLAYVMAKSLSALCFSLLICSLLFGIALLGTDVTMSASQWLGLLGTALLGTLPFCGLGLWLGLKLSAKAAPAVVNLVYLAMAMCSGLWVPITLLPESMQTFAWLLPSYHLSQLALSVLSMHQGHPIGLHLIILSAFAIAFALLASHQWRKLY